VLTEAHFPALHRLLVQSDATPHVLPTAQCCEQDPPQSTSVSFPFLMPSLHVGAATHFPALQRLLAQSAAAMQFLLAAQGAHEPPQSTSVSPPSVSPLVQWVVPS